MIARRLCCAALLLASPALWAGRKPLPPAPEVQVECVSAERASELNGRYGCVSGKVYRVHSAKNGSIHLSLCSQRGLCSFSAVVRPADLGNVGDVYALRGKLVAITGRVSQNRRGHPQIAVKSREQLHVTAGNPPPESDPALANPGKAPGKHGRAW